MLRTRGREIRLRRQSAFQETTRTQINVDHRNGQARGFGYCRDDVVQYESFANLSGTKYWDRPASNRIDEQEIFVSKPRNGSDTFFERDEFLFNIFQIGFRSIFGDV